jgi:hypothetical protein
VQIGRGGRILLFFKGGIISSPQMRRLWAIVLILILVGTLIPFINGTLFDPPHTEFGEDTDGDGDFNYLTVNVAVNVDVPGDYIIDGILTDSTPNIIDYQINFTALEAGQQIVELKFEGWLIRANGVKGPYTIDLVLYDGSYHQLDNDTLETTDYFATDFELPPGQFGSPHSDYGLDTDGDGLFNYLVVLHGKRKIVRWCK